MIVIAELPVAKGVTVGTALAEDAVLGDGAGDGVGVGTGVGEGDAVARLVGVAVGAGCETLTGDDVQPATIAVNTIA